jgi:hypothetical protein
MMPRTRQLTRRLRIGALIEEVDRPIEGAHEFGDAGRRRIVYSV